MQIDPNLYECKIVQGTLAFHSVRTLGSAIVEMWTRKLYCFCYPCSSGEWDNCESIDWVYSQDHVSLPIGRQITSELSQLEEGQSSISRDYDHISDLIQPSSTIMLITLKCLTTSCFQLADSQVCTLFYAGHIYAVVSLRDNEWHTDYQLAHFFDGKHTLIVSLSDSEGNYFQLGRWLSKGNI